MVIKIKHKSFQKKFKNKTQNMNQRGQITIFIILALIIIVLIVLVFLLRRGPEVGVVSEENPQAFIESCTREAVEEAVEIIMLNAGGLEPKGTILYQGENITYLCYEKNYYKGCVNQKPMLIRYIKNEITEYVKPRISNCFQTLEKELEPRYVVEMEENWNLETILTSQGVEIEINREFKMERGDNIRSFELFRINYIHPIYRLAEIAMEIVNQEARFCNFDILGFMIFYPEYDIQKFRTGDSNTIYTLREFTGNKEFKFAIRSCAIPAGF